MTTATQLRIDTAVLRASGPPSAKSTRKTAAVHDSSRLQPDYRGPLVSPASTSSTISLISPAPSSTNASTSSLLIPHASTSYSASSLSTAPSPKPSTPPQEEVESEYVLAMHDFVPEQRNGTCLSFRAGQVIHVLNRDASGWWDGELDGSRGWFPSNYVNGDLGLLADDAIPPSLSRAINHSHSRSAVSVTSFTSSASSRNGPFSRSDYCPPLMAPLLHAMALLQNAVRSNRIAHYQPSVACIISCVRSILAAAECLSRDSPFLRRFAPLAQERKRVLSDLAAIVTQAKRASVDQMDENERDAEVEKMVRLGGQVFSRVRRFLAVAVQCGVELPDKAVAVEYPSFGGQPSSPHKLIGAPGDEDTTLHASHWPKTNATVAQRPRMRVRDRPGTPGKAKSMSDLRTARPSFSKPANREPMPAMPGKVLQAKVVTAPPRPSSHRHELSTSSTSSSSSFSSVESFGTPITPPFPSGPSSYEELMDALRHTHDQYLSTIAAFIGHAHTHSRTSHAASTGHMYELVREIVEIVCKLLTIVEAVLRHPTVPPHKADNLKAAKEGLYNVTSGLAESVRMLTGVLPEGVTEEQEKAALIRCATDALKAGADCVAAVKMCLSRSSGEKPFVIQLPRTAEQYSEPVSPRNFLRTMSPRLIKSVSMDTMQHSPVNEEDDEDDLTVQVHPHPTHLHEGRPIIAISDEQDVAQPFSPGPPPSPMLIPEDYPPAAGKSPRHGLPALHLASPDDNGQAPLLSPTSSYRTDDDGTTWEGSSREDHGKALEEKILSGELPSVPPSEPSTDQNPDVWFPDHDYSPEDIAYNSEGHLVGATLGALVEKMTPHASIVDAAFSAVFFMTFRLFASPPELVQAIIDRYNIVPPPGLTEDQVYIWGQRKGIPIRLRISNFVKQWLESFWRPSSDNVVLQTLHDFNRDALAEMFPSQSVRLHDMIMARMQVDDVLVTPRFDRVRDAGMAINPPVVNSPSEIPRPVMTKALLTNLRKHDFNAIYIIDFDSLELARQLTIMECHLFCSIQPEEILETGQEGAAPAINVRAVTTLSTIITGWIAESILNETDTKKRTLLVKFFIKLADRCTTLHNYSTSRSILAALDSSTISRLHQTWVGVPQKQKQQLDAIRKLADHARNYHEYRSKLRNTAPPAVPFLGLYLTDITFSREGNPSHRPSPLAADKKLLNFNKYHKMARIVQDMQRFQVPYTLKGIPEVQSYLNHAFERSKHHGDLQDLYRRSLLVEPKRPADTPPSGDVRQLFPWRTQTIQSIPSS
ncbi:ras guanine nucleotide exchange factor domain-containing protein [Amylostereum chailletii]|nr:ras guanine nucleotide exchange factor domain-containing protein [Amylostereum chailletii]